MVAWSSKKQGIVVRSSTEAEYRAIATTVEEVEPVRTLLTELGIDVPVPLKILSDNLGATFIAQNPVCHTKLKHVREKVEKGSLQVEHISGIQQKADILTKALRPKPLQELQCKLVGSPTSLRGQCYCNQQFNTYYSHLF